jgi:hypothetical protein
MAGAGYRERQAGFGLVQLGLFIPNASPVGLARQAAG